MGVFDFLKLKDNFLKRPSKKQSKKLKESFVDLLTKDPHIELGVQVDDIQTLFPFTVADLASGESGNFLILESQSPPAVSIPLDRSKGLIVYFISREKPYTFKSQFIEKVEVEGRGSKQIKIQYPEEILFAQRRHYFRIYPPSDQPITLSFITHSKKVSTTDVVDISAGGISAILQGNEHISKVGDTCELLHIILPGQKQLTVSSEIVAISPLENQRFKYAFQFTGISEDTSETILKYVLLRQREDSKKRLDL